MSLTKKVLAVAASSLVIGSAVAAGNPNVEHNTQQFLNALEKGGGQPLETLSPKDALDLIYRLKDLSRRA